MSKKSIKRALAVGLATVTALSSTGCQSMIGGAESLPLVPALTSSELRDYYAEGLKYDSIISRNNEVHETTYVLQDVSDEKAAVLKDLTNQAQAILASKEYELTEDNLKIVSEDNYNYIKAFLNDKSLNGGEVADIKGALGYYFVDVNYTLGTQSLGEYKPYANLVGINGAFYKDVYDIDQVDSLYLISAADSINEYYAENKIFKEASYDENSATFSIKDVEQIAVEQPSEPEQEPTEGEVPVEGEVPAEGEGEVAPAETGPEPAYTGDTEATEEVEETEATEDTTEDTTESEEGADDAEVPEGEEPEVVDEYVDEEALESLENIETTAGATEGVGRRVQALPANIINSVAGSSIRQAAYMPELDLVYERPENSGTIGGIGLYSTGTDGLTLFGFDKSYLGGNVTLRYVFKEAYDGSGELVGFNVYPTFYELTSGITISNNKSDIPDYLEGELAQLLERSDRAIINNDLSALVSGVIHADMGVGMLRGYESQSTNLLKHMSTIRTIISRDIENNAYLLEIETTRQEGPKDVDVYGTYRDKYYMVVEQVDGEFYITDMIMSSRTITKHPEINPDSAAKKRLASLNLTGEVSDTAKKAANTLLDDLYKAGTYRKLRVESEADKQVNGVTLNRGMYDCFNSNPEMLSSDQLEYYNSSLRDRLTKYGANVEASMYGTVTEWIGGTENQIEFTTEELITFKGKSDSIKMNVYYLVSCMEDVWVIDEMTILEEVNLETNGDTNSVKERIGADKFLY